MIDRSQYSVLVVDDNDANRYATARNLRAAGFNIVEAAAGAEALELGEFVSAVVLDVHLPDTRLGLYLATVVALGMAYLLCRFITVSKLGRVLLALRDTESRVRFLGYSTTHAKLFVFTVSAVLAGIAGAHLIGALFDRAGRTVLCNVSRAVVAPSRHT